jgi:hypothetical protein
LLQNLQSFPCFLLPLLNFFQLLLNLMKFLIQLSLSKHKPCTIFLPFLLMDFKFQGINPMLNMFSLIQDYALEIFQLPEKLSQEGKTRFAIGVYDCFLVERNILQLTI